MILYVSIVPYGMILKNYENLEKLILNGLKGIVAINLMIELIFLRIKPRKD